MFTGIIEGLGTITGIQSSGQGSCFSLTADFSLEGTKVGDSIAVNGACLTAVHVEGKQFRVDVKGHGGKNFWEIRKREPKNDLFYILVDIFTEKPNYYIMSSKEMMNEWDIYYQDIKKLRKKKGTKIPKDDYRWGIRHTQAVKYEHKWEKLP